MHQALDKLNNATVKVSDNNAYPENGAASVIIEFSEGTMLRADYWRVIKDRKQLLSSFDHQQKYGLSNPIDAKAGLQSALHDLNVVEARLDHETGDLIFQFTNDCKLQILNFTGYEIWEITFPDGSQEYSNDCREYIDNAEKLVSIQTAETFFAERRARGDVEQALAFLSRKGGEAPRAGDVLAE